MGSYLTTNALVRSAEELSLIAGASPFFDGQLLTTLEPEALDLAIQVSILELLASTGFNPYVARSTFVVRDVVWYAFVFERTQVIPVSVQAAFAKGWKVRVPPRLAMKINSFHG